MSQHLFGMVLTHQGTYANNRGENEGNASTLQKVIRNGELFTTVSAEAIRYALRQAWQNMGPGGPALNRLTEDHCRVRIQWPDYGDWARYLDDDALGFLHAREESRSRRGVLEVTRALSTTPWRGELVQNFASPGSNPGVTHDHPIPYVVEIHHTRYQYGFALTPAGFGRPGPGGPDSLDAGEKRRRLSLVLAGLLNLSGVGGNHARFLTDFSPQALVLRWTHDPAPRFLYCFFQDERGNVSLGPLARRIRGGDVEAGEFIVGAALDIREQEELTGLGAGWRDGVKRAVEDLLSRVSDEDLA
ncbi:MAG: type I-B CRISPR-associated protein Cas7/Cst2/DevR [Proteobacteria bacterium]|nr:type I-B CRISPR-associated protein Cas7/Cst2/DevR [Pseudomonadota bacterium]